MIERVYFTWPDRRVGYDCRGCGACCKGHGIGLDVTSGQLVQLVAKRPELAAFVRKRGDAVTAFNPRDRCWFLADDGLCRIEVEDGRAAKPASCRLFPFNRVFRIGSYTVVDYNSVICPLRLHDGDGVAHDDIIAEIASIRDAAIVGTQLPPKPADDATIASEQTIAAAIFAGTHPWAAQGGTELERERIIAAFEAVLAQPWREPTPATLANAIALTPSLRFNELYGPRNYAPAVLARIWLAWIGFAALGEALAQRVLGLQELTTMWSEQAPLMHAIARWHDVPQLKPGPVELPNEPRVKQLAQSFVDNRKSRRALGALAGVLGDEVTSRVTSLKLADPILRAASYQTTH